MTPAYCTGKVKIGSNYHPDTRPHIEGDMLTLQTALINSNKFNTSKQGRLNQPKKTTSAVLTPTDKWLDNCNAVATLFVWAITGYVAAWFFIIMYEICIEHLS